MGLHHGLKKQVYHSRCFGPKLCVCQLVSVHVLFVRWNDFPLLLCSSNAVFLKVSFMRLANAEVLIPLLLALS